MKAALPLLAAGWLVACGPAPPPVTVPAAPVPAEAAPPAGVEEPARAAELMELWSSEPRPEEGIAGLAVWSGGGDRAWLLATTAHSDRLLVYDAVTGEALRELGGAGQAPGRFGGAAALAVVDDLLLVAERTNRRVQVLRLPGLASLGFLGEEVLDEPSSLAAVRDGEVYEVWIADRGPGERHEASAEAGIGAPAAGEAGRGAVSAGRIVRLRFSLAGDAALTELAVAEVAVSHGDTTRGEAALAPLSALGIDPARERLVIAEEAAAASGLWVLAAGGGFTGRAAEGLAGPVRGLGLQACGAGAGVWVAAEAGDGPTRFLVLDRAALAPLGSFTGQLTRGGGGLAIAPPLPPELPAGALYAIDAGERINAFDWTEIAAALSPAGCTDSPD